MDLDPQLLDVLACPACHSPLRPEDTEDTEGADAAGELACTGCGLRYPVRDGIPILLVDEARNPDPQ